MKKFFLSLLLVSSFQLFAIEKIERVLIEKAETPEQKQVVREYLLKIASEHEALAKRYLKMSKATKGGKVVYQSNRKEEMEEIAQQFTDDAKIYRDEARKLK